MNSLSLKSEESTLLISIIYTDVISPLYSKTPSANKDK